MQGEPIKRIKISYVIRLLLAFLASCLWLAIKLGDSNIPQSNFKEIDQSIEYVFETTLAIERKRFRKRIESNQTGILSYLPMVNQRWIELEVELITRIGFKVEQLNSLVKNGNFNEIVIQVLQPAILDRKWETTIIQKSDSFLHRWEIEQYEKERYEMITEVIDAESFLMLENFKNDNSKMGALVHRVENQLARLGDMNALSLNALVGKFNRKVNQYVEQLFGFENSQKSSYSNYRTYSSVEKEKTSNRQYSHKKKSQQREKRNEQIKSTRKIPEISKYDKEEDQMRKQMKEKLKK